MTAVRGRRRFQRGPRKGPKHRSSRLIVAAGDIDEVAHRVVGCLADLIPDAGGDRNPLQCRRVDVGVLDQADEMGGIHNDNCALSHGET